MLIFITFGVSHTTFLFLSPDLISIPAFILFELPSAPVLVVKMAVLYVQQEQEREVQRVVVSLHLKLSDELSIDSKCLSQLVVAFV